MWFWHYSSAHRTTSKLANRLGERGGNLRESAVGPMVDVGDCTYHPALPDENPVKCFSKQLKIGSVLAISVINSCRAFAFQRSLPRSALVCIRLSPGRRPLPVTLLPGEGICVGSSILCVSCRKSTRVGLAPSGRAAHAARHNVHRRSRHLPHRPHLHQPPALTAPPPPQAGCNSNAHHQKGGRLRCGRGDIGRHQ